MSSNNDHQENSALVPQQPVQLPSYAPPLATEPGQQTHPLRKIQRLLRGRYHWAILLGIIFAGGLGTLGYRSVKPLYQSTGMIGISPTIPKLLSDHTNVMPMFRSYVQKQVALMQSPRVIKLARSSDAWQRLHRPDTRLAENEFADHLNVEQSKSDELISVSFADPDPKAAQIAVGAVIDAYMHIFGETDAQSQTNRVQILQSQQQTQKSQLKSLREQILSIANEYGSDALDEAYNFNVQEQQKLDQALTETQLSLAMAGAKTKVQDGGKNKAQAAGAQAQQLTVDQIAAQDPHMAKLLNQRESAEQNIQLLTTRFGPRYPDVVQAETRLRLIKQAIDKYAKAYRAYAAANTSMTNIVAGQPGQPTVAQLRTRLASLEALYKDARQKTLDLGRKKLKIDNLKEQEADVQKTLTAINNRIQQLNFDSLISGRIQVISSGDPASLTPINHSKIRQRAALGVVGGGALGVGLIMLLGFFDRRLQRSDDAIQPGRSSRLLGVLPTLPEDVSDPEAASLAGSCVHHIRTLLQLAPESHDKQVFTVTGPVAGAGKTSLTLSLGLSFATAGSRTLLIDSDLAAGGLSNRLEAIIRRRMGQILLRESLITNDQLQDALKRSGETGQRLGETLIELGMVTAEQISQALEMQQQATVGLLDCLAGEPLDQCIAETGIKRLSILPVGGAKAHDAGRVSPSSLQNLIEEARERYDIVLIDSGPVPGNVETSIVAAAADQAILVVSRGDHRPRVERAVTYLQSIGADLAGVVFNRANPDDTSRSGYGDSSIYRPSPPVAPSSNGHTSGYDRRYSRFDPLARAVVSSSSENENENENSKDEDEK